MEADPCAHVREVGRPRSLPIIGAGEVAVLVCWCVGVVVLGGLMAVLAVAGLVGGGVPVFGVLGGVGGPAGGGVGESEVDEAS